MIDLGTLERTWAHLSAFARTCVKLGALERTGWLAGWLAGCLIGLAGCLAGWLTGWLAWNVVRVAKRSVTRSCFAMSCDRAKHDFAPRSVQSAPREHSVTPPASYFLYAFRVVGAFRVVNYNEKT